MHAAPLFQGGTIITRYLLEDLLDKLEDVLGPGRSHTGAGSGAPNGNARPGADHHDEGDERDSACH
jgi:hypothetical protein